MWKTVEVAESVEEETEKSGVRESAKAPPAIESLAQGVVEPTPTLRAEAV